MICNAAPLLFILLSFFPSYWLSLFSLFLFSPLVFVVTTIVFQRQRPGVKMEEEACNRQLRKPPTHHHSSLPPAAIISVEKWRNYSRKKKKEGGQAKKMECGGEKKEGKKKKRRKVFRHTLSHSVHGHFRPSSSSSSKMPRIL